MTIKKRNPVIKKAYEDGKSKGYSLGLELGELKGEAKAIAYFNKKFMKLQDTPGIGPKTLDKIGDTLGWEYIIKVDSDGS